MALLDTPIAADDRVRRALLMAVLRSAPAGTLSRAECARLAREAAIDPDPAVTAALLGHPDTWLRAAALAGPRPPATGVAGLLDDPDVCAQALHCDPPAGRVPLLMRHLDPANPLLSVPAYLRGVSVLAQAHVAEPAVWARAFDVLNRFLRHDETGQLSHRLLTTLALSGLPDGKVLAEAAMRVRRPWHPRLTTVLVRPECPSRQLLTQVAEQVLTAGSGPDPVLYTLLASPLVPATTKARLLPLAAAGGAAAVFDAGSYETARLRLCADEDVLTSLAELPARLGAAAERAYAANPLVDVPRLLHRAAYYDAELLEQVLELRACPELAARLVLAGRTVTDRHYTDQVVAVLCDRYAGGATVAEHDLPRLVARLGGVTAATVREFTWRAACHATGLSPAFAAAFAATLPSPAEEADLAAVHSAASDPTFRVGDVVDAAHAALRG